MYMHARSLGVNTKLHQMYLASEDGHNKYFYSWRKINKDNNTAIYTSKRSWEFQRDLIDQWRCRLPSHYYTKISSDFTKWPLCQRSCMCIKQMLLFGNTEQYIRFNAILHGGVCVCQTLYWSEGSIKVDIFLNLIHAIKSLIPKITAWICNSIWQENKFVTACSLILWLLFTGWWSLELHQ